MIASISASLWIVRKEPDTKSNALFIAAALRLVLNGSKMGARLADVYYAMPSMSNQAVLT